MDIVDNAAVQFTASNNFASEIKARIERSEVIKDNKHSKELLVFLFVRTSLVYVRHFISLYKNYNC